MRVLVCGGREYEDVEALKAELDAIHAEFGISELIHGAARGADSLAAAWAKSLGIPTRAFPADWNRHGKSAGFRRNEAMLCEGRPDAVIAFPGGKGTAHMVKLAVNAGIHLMPIVKKNPDGV